MTFAIYLAQCGEREKVGEGVTEVDIRREMLEWLGYQIQNIFNLTHPQRRKSNSTQIEYFFGR